MEFLATERCEALVRDVLAYLERTKVAKSRLGREAMNDGEFVDKLQHPGRRVTVETERRVRKCMADHPDGWRRKNARA